MELRQLRYFIALAEELHFGRAAETGCTSRVRRSPSRSRPWSESSSVQLFDRNPRSLVLTAAGAALLPQARELLAHAAELRTQAAGLADFERFRFGYISWRPADLAERTAGVPQLRFDAWVLQSQWSPVATRTGPRLAPSSKRSPTAQATWV